MNELPKNKSGRRISRTFLIWLASFLLIALAAGIALLKTDRAPEKFPDIVWSLVFGVLGASVLVCVLIFIRWLSCWSNLRRTLVGLAILATVVAIFYTEEDWRGKIALENCEREIEAQGIVLDWNKLMPPTVPDDQNFFTTSSNILERFKQHGSTNDPDYQMALDNSWLRLQITSSNSFPILDTSNGAPLVIAKVFFVSPSVSLPAFDTNTYKLALNDPALPEKLENIIHKTIGQTIDGAQGYEFFQFQLTNIEPVQIVISADTPPSLNDIENRIPSGIVKKFARLQVVPTANPWNFYVQLLGIRITAAADYLKWSDQYVPAFDDIREALKRPDAIIPGDYSVPYRMPIPNFVTMRALAQTLAQRAQCDLLLGEPNEALHELTLVHNVCRILEKPPTGQPETLVEAMINVAIHGLYVQIIAEGMQRHAWQEPQLEALQEQLRQINLPPIVFGCLREDIPAFAASDAETMSPQQWYGIVGDKISWPAKTGLWLMPRGWVDQNIVVVLQLDQLWCNGFDPTSQTVFPQKLDASWRKIDGELGRHHSPFYLFADIAIPNFSKAWQTTAYNQTMVNEAQIACALERCRLANGEYPDSLDVLVPGYIQTIPQDIIGGQPLHYRRTDDGKFLLYSVGWNERDDGGKVVLNQSGAVNYSTGDWVWLGGIK